MDNIENLLNQSDYCFFFLVVDNYLDIKLYPKLKYFYPIYAFINPSLAELKENNSPYFCLEESGVKIDQKNSGRLLESPSVIQYITEQSRQINKRPVVVPFKPSAKIELVCRQNNWICAANPATTNRTLEDKIKFFQTASQCKLPLVPGSIDQMSPTNFLKYQQIYGLKLVVQSHFGWAGNSTRLIESVKDIPENIIDTTVKFSPLLRGYSLLNNCVLTYQGLIQSPPALQYTGLQPFTSNPFTTVGRQWPSLAPQEVTDQIKDISQRFSDLILAPLDYRGFFGLDFFVTSDNKVLLLECNPRLTASFAFYTSIEQKNNLTPLFYFHLAEFISRDYNFDLTANQSRFDSPSIIGSEITARNQQGNLIYKYHDFRAFSSSTDPVTIDPHTISIIKPHLN